MAYGAAHHVWGTHALNPGAVFKAQALTCVTAAEQPGFTDLLQPLGRRIVAHMTGVAQHFDALQVGVEQRATRRHYIDEGRDAARLEHPPHFTQGQAQVTPVMRRITAEDVIERSIGEWQALGGTAFGDDIFKVTLSSGGSHHVEHLLRQVVSHHFTHQGRDMKTHMAGATAKIQHSRPPLPGQLSLEQREFAALGVDSTAQVGTGLLAELALDDVFMRGAGHEISLALIAGNASSHTACAVGADVAGDGISRFNALVRRHETTKADSPGVWLRKWQSHRCPARSGRCHPGH
ncbi:hypothetical protein D3C78_911390 [compost metagenome]